MIRAIYKYMFTDALIKYVTGRGALLKTYS